MSLLLNLKDRIFWYTSWKVSMLCPSPKGEAGDVAYSSGGGGGCFYLIPRRVFGLYSEGVLI